MAKKIKDYYDTDCARLLADKIVPLLKSFRSDEFISMVAGNLEGKEFSARQDLYVRAFDTFLPDDYEGNIALFSRILGPELNTTEGMFSQGWWLWPVGRYVEKHGTENHDVSMDFIFELTKRFTGEFAVRPLIADRPRRTLERLVEWSLDENVHVRRLSSEGMRLRLPWAKKSYAALEEFELYEEVLSNLRYDTEKFVQKSVGNNLNDLMKEDSDAAMAIIRRWEADAPSRETHWIIKHGMRSLKKGKKDG